MKESMDAEIYIEMFVLGLNIRREHFSFSWALNLESCVVKGWVYVISNDAMPGLVKVGFSSKDPDLRASELNHTGSPHPYIVDYEVLTEHPRDIEQRVHRKLSEYREGREWFRCAPEFAVSAVQQIVGDGAIVESFKRADRLKAAEIRRQHEGEKENQERAEARWQEQEQQIRTTYEQRLQETFPKHPVWGYIVAGIVLSFFALSGFGPKLSDGAAAFWSLVTGVVGGLVGKEWYRNYQKTSDGYRAILKQRDEELLSVRSKLVISCPKCNQGLRIPRGKNLMVKCSACRTEFSHQS